MEQYTIIKRTGDFVAYDKNRIQTAVRRAAIATPDHSHLPVSVSQDVADEVEKKLAAKFFEQGKSPNIEEIQDIVEEVFVELGYFQVAKCYILYRTDRARARAEKRILELEKIDKDLLKVTKENGKKERFSKKKLEKTWKNAAREYEKDCPFEEVYEVFKLTLSDEIKTSQILKNLRKACIDQISTKNILWQNVAGRLYIFEMYKKAMRNRKMKRDDIYSPDSYLKHYKDYLKKNYYSSKFPEIYSDADIKEAAMWINKEQDFAYTYSTVLTFDKRYLLNPNKVIAELPQEMYLTVALFLAIPEEKKNRLNFAKKLYKVISNQQLSLPTPTLLNARTNFHQLSSCFKLNVDDDLRSIYHSVENMAQISKFGGGVGVYLGHVRSRGASIRGVHDASGGVVPWVRVINDTACAVNQLGARAGAISPTIDVWHRDIYDFLNLQTESGDIRSKAFDVYPAVSMPDLFMKRVQEDKDWTLLDPHEVKEVFGKALEDSFGTDFDKFYEECEKSDKLRLKETVPAKELFKEFLKTTVETGMPYVFFRDTVNELNPNKHVGNVYSTQLCTEICQNTSPSKFSEEVYEDGKVNIKYEPGDTVVCNLASINMAKVFTKKDIDEVFPVAMRALDNVITLNYYPIKESELTSKKYRPVGLGFMGLAEYLACNGYAYESEEAREHVDELFEEYAYACLDASNKLSEERGEYEYFKGSEWSKGKFFGKDATWFKKNAKTKLDWDKLIKNVKDKGLRFGYHMAPAPNTSTSIVVGTTAGLLPVYKKFFIETNSLAPVVNVAPNLDQENFWLYKEYQHMDMKEVIDMISVVYKWVDQSISFEWMINPVNISPKDLYELYMRAWEKRLKTVYYVRSMSVELSEVCESCSG